MQIINSNKLTKNQISDIDKLVGLCKLEDKTKGIIFLESDMNEYPDFKCFYLVYENSQLTSFLSVFIPNQDECEIYAYTLPPFRKKGLSKKLLKEALIILNNYNIKSVFLTCEPESNSGILTLKSINADYELSEYMMKYDENIKPKPEHKLILKYNNKSGYYETLLNNMVIGKCNIDNSEFCTTIYNFEITEKKRGQGYGKESLLLILENLLNDNCSNIVLHLSSYNKRAYNLYCNNGFYISSQVDYWKLV